MKAVVHLGMPKSGTTAIQRTLQTQGAALAARGVAYQQIPTGGPVPPQDSQVEFGIVQFARAGEPVPDPGTRLSYAIGDEASHRAFAARFEAAFAAARGGRTEPLYLISSEHIGAWTHSAAQARALDDWLAQHFDKVRYLMYFRRQEDWVLSNYSQALRMGSAEGLESYAEKLLVSHYDTRAFAWAEAVGERFAPRLMEPDALKGDLFADFAAAAGFDATGIPRPARENESLSVPAAEFLRIMNAALPQRVRGGRVRNPLMRGVQQRLTKWYAGERKLALPEATIARIREANAEGNERLRAAFFPERPALFPERPAPAPAAPPSVEEIAHVGIDLLVAVRTGRMQCMNDTELATLKADGALQRQT